MSAVDAMCETIFARKVRNGEPCRDGMCGRTEGVWSAGAWRDGGTMPASERDVWQPGGECGACPTCETQEALWWAFWAAMGAPNGPGS